MRADAARNLDAVLQTGATLLAEDPGASVAAIAEAAGVDRRTVYRRFPNRDALLCAVFQAKLDAFDEVIDRSRLTEAPVGVALHRFVEGAVEVVRRFPVGHEQMGCSEGAFARHLEQTPPRHEYGRSSPASSPASSTVSSGCASSSVVTPFTVIVIRRRSPTT